MAPPNVVLILADDMGFSDVGCYGGEIRTPSIDRLARGGVRFSQFYNTARCSPSRASLLTGLDPHQTGIGVLTNDDRPLGYPGTINDHCVTLAEVLKGAGYATCLSSKWHLASDMHTPNDPPDQADAAVLDWLRERPGERTIIPSICGGAQMVADSGILAGHTATSHHTILGGVTRSHPEVNWVTGVRYVDDGRFISSAGVTSGVDATLYTLQQFIGRDGALATAERIGYPHTEFLDDRTWEIPAVSDVVTFPNFWRTDRTRIGLFVYPGVDELALSSVTDTYPRALATDVLTIGTERTMIRTRHGLDVAPRYSLASAPTPDRVLIPGHPDVVAAAPVERWAHERMDRAAEYIHAAGGYAYDLTLADMARQETRPIARNAARWIEYPTTGLDLGDRDWQPAVALRGAVLGLLGLAVLLGVKRTRGWGRSPTTSGTGQPRRVHA